MTAKKQSTKKGGTKGKAEGSEKVTAERLRDFLADPSVKESAKRRVRRLVGDLYEAGEWDTLPEEPELYMLEFQQTYINDHLARGTAEPAESEIYEKLAAVINRSEPKDALTVRRLSEVLRDPLRPTAPEVILRAINDIANTTGASDLHPEIFPTLARVLMREARARLRAKGLDGFTRKLLRDSLRKLQAVADA
jgi:hypothetical protein